MIRWNGISSDSLGVIVQQYPKKTVARRKLTAYSVPGRTGDIVETDGMSFENYQQQYSVFIEGGRDADLPLRARKIAEWLMSPEGYAKLEDSYDHNSFRYAYYEGPLDIESWFDIHGQATLEFNVDPHRYLNEGQEVLRFNADGTLYNPTAFPAKPLIMCYYPTGGSYANTGEIVINGVTVSLSQILWGTTVDCQTGNCYAPSTPNWNGNLYISMPTIPELLPGENTISFTKGTGHINYIEIIPRWWTL